MTNAIATNTVHEDAMTRDEIIAEMHNELRKHGLRKDGWTAELNDRTTRTYGRCYYRERRIEVSWALARLNARDETMDTIRHEVAHALAGAEAGHGDRWKTMCMHTGAKPSACYDGKEVVQPWTYAVICDGCGETVAHRVRNRKKPFYHWANACKAELKDNVKARQLRWIHRDALPEAQQQHMYID